MFNDPIQSVMDRVDALRHEVNDHWQIPKDQALVLSQIVRIVRCRSGVEIGVSYGYSTLHLAAALREAHGHLHAVERADKKVNAATAHLTEAGLIDTVTIHPGDALQVLPTLQPAEPIDFVFIDATKEEAVEYLRLLMDKLAPRAIIIADNTGNLAERMAPYVHHVRGLPGAVSCDVPVGNGFELTVLSRET